MHPVENERLNPGDLVVLKRREIYGGICKATNSFVAISKGDVCIWLGKDETKVGTRSYPRVIHEGRVIDVADDGLFKKIC